MIDRVQEIYAVGCYPDCSFPSHYSALMALHIFLELEENMSVKCHELSQLKVLEDAVQEIVSAEKTPTLSIVVPL